MKAMIFSTVFLIVMTAIIAFTGKAEAMGIMFSLTVVNYLVAVIVLELIKIREAIKGKS